MVCFGTGVVCRYLSIPRKTLDDWCRKGVAPCEANGRGTGHRRRFTVIQILALAYAYRFIGWQGGLHMAKAIMEFITSHTEQQLKAKFARGKKYLIPLPEAMRLVDELGFDGDEIYDLEAVYNTTVEYLRELESEYQAMRNN
jgi:hypothetical protein